jgi:tryptophan synthase alpha chain
MNRIERVFAQQRAAGRTVLIPYVTVGDPSLRATDAILDALVVAGADLIELGVPFSDPMADGPVIQKSSERALRHGVSLKDVIGYVRSFREADSRTPVVLFGYANPVETMGVEGFADAAEDAGADGALIVDYPPEEAEPLVERLDARGLDTIFLLSPTTAEERLSAVARLGRGYLYYVSLRGVTGAAHIDIADVASHIARIRAHTPLPVGVGFGIRDPQTAQRIAAVADAVVIGTRLVQEIESVPRDEVNARVTAFLRSVRDAMDQPSAVVA